ncbi:MAG: putative lipid II flippase FtsW [Verrucomicrobiota bacterium]
MKLATTTLIFCVAALLSLGMVILYSSSTAQVGPHYLIMQLAWCGIGLVGATIAATLDYHQLKKVSLPLLIFAVVLLLLVFVPHVGIKVNGASRWIGHGAIRFQPSELAKIALIIFIAHYSERFQRLMGTFVRGLVVPGLVVAGVLALIFVEKDRGCAILLAAVSGTMLIIAGVRLKFIIPPAILTLTALAFSFWHDPMRLKRILAWLHPEESREGVGYQAYQAMIALGTGGWNGLGLGNGRQKLGFVPEHHTDFIFSIIGEELGLVATIAVVVVFLLLVICGIFISSRARDPFGLLLGSGVTFLIGFQAFINIGVVTSTLPNKGMPLPFISYGGSNLLAMLVAVGILLSVARQALETTRKKANPFDEEAAAPQLT